MHSHRQSAPATAALSVLYLGRDESLVRRLRPPLSAQSIELATALPDALPERPDGLAAAVVDASHLPPGLTLKDIAERLCHPKTLPADPQTVQAQAPAVPLVVIGEPRNLGAHLEALRAGAAAYLTAPVSAVALAERLMTLCRPPAGFAGRVLVVEAGAVGAIVAERALKGVGFSVHVLTEPLKLLETLDTVRPELIVMELDLAEASGAELAAVVREQEEFAALPILFVSAEHDPERQLQALAMGGDAFLPKPIWPALLAEAVSRRIAAARTLRARVRMEERQDPDTGLTTRRRFLSCLERALSEPDIELPGNGLLAIALDQTSRLTDAVGSGGLCMLLDRVGRLIQGRLAPGDLATRMDDRHLAVLVRRTDDGSLSDFADELCQAVAGYPVAVGGKLLSTTVSIGIGGFAPPADDALTLLARAGTACAEALGAGGNRVVSHTAAHFDETERTTNDRLAGLIRAAADAHAPSGTLKLYYQPLVAVQPGRHHYLEVQPCLEPPGEPSLPAPELFAAAARAGRIGALDRAVMLGALKALHAHASDQPGLRLLVPQHLAGLADRDWVHWIRGCLAEMDLAERPPLVELAAEDVLANRQAAPLPLKMLHKIGVKLCLTGIDHRPATLDLVVDIQPSMVVLAPGVTQELRADRFSFLMQRLRRTDTRIVACGIDSFEQISQVWESGVHYAQGALIQEPLSEPVVS